jgi:multiple sugar transport system ATP-binding protein
MEGLLHNMASVKLTGIEKRYGSGAPVLHGVDLDIGDGEFMVLVGPSGCGKSTLLRIIAGLERADAGTLDIGGARASDVPPAQRGVAMVFQSYALYPHMTVYENMAFALKLSGAGKDTVRAAVQRTAEALQIGHLLERRPKDLSGGQRQRVAIGRAIVRQPRVFLFDEPLSNLDAGLRAQMRQELARLHRELGATMVYVTHDQVEAMTLGDRIAVFNGGRIEQVGTPQELYHAPATRFVAGFLGAPAMNFLPAPHGEGLTLGIRPEHVRIDPAGGTSARVTHTEYLGDHAVVFTDAGVALKLPVQDSPPAPGAPLRLSFPPERTHYFDASGRAVPGVHLDTK